MGVVSLIRVAWDDHAIRYAMSHDPKVLAGADRLAAKAVNEMKRLAPVSKVQRVYATRGATVPGGTRHRGDFPLRPSGYLRSSIHAFRHGEVILIGPTADYATFVNDGTPPHSIDSSGPWPLRNRATGQVFGRHVNHPGTKATHFIERTAESLGGTVIRL